MDLSQNVIQNDGQLEYFPILVGRALEIYQRQLRRVERGLRLLPIRHEDEFVFSIRFRALPGTVLRQTNVIPRILAILRDRFRLVGRISGRISVEPIGEGDEQAFVRGGGIGGNARLERRFQELTRDQLTIPNIFEQLEMNHYDGFEFTDLLWEVTFPFTTMLMNFLVGGSFHEERMPRLPKGMYWHEFQTWSTGDKIRYRRAASSLNKGALKGERGLYFYPPPSQGFEMGTFCGYMALMYGVEHAKYRRGEVHCLNEWQEHPQRMYDAMVQRFGEEESLTITNPAALKHLLEQVAPNHELVIVDQRHQPKDIYRGSQFSPTYPEHCVRNAFDPLFWESWMHYRIYIFHDESKWHFLPIFDLRVFFQPNTAKGEVGHAYLPCPCCNTLVSKLRCLEHHCARYQCTLCFASFGNIKHWYTHCVGGGRGRMTFYCKGCGAATSNSKCLAKHETVCVGEYYETCMRCHSQFCISDRESHRCPPGYYCCKCKAYVTNEPQYDMDRRDMWDRYREYRTRHHLPIEEIDPTLFVYFQLHECLPLASPKPKVIEGDVFAFDFECRLDPITTEEPLLKHLNSLGHTMNMGCGIRLASLEGPPVDETPFVVDSMASFWDKVVVLSTGKETVWYAHNLKGYDSAFLWEFFRDNDIVPSMVLMQGQKIMYMAVPHPQDSARRIVFKDSLLLISMSVKKMPKAFSGYRGIETYQKGYFPYLFNTLANVGYRGSLPDRMYFDYHKMGEDDKIAFDIWYAKKENCVYDLHAEMEEYCIQDTMILKLALEAYRHACWKTTGLDALASLTRAQFTYDSYLTADMPQGSIVRLDTNQSEFARRAFRGGRTDVRRLKYILTEAEYQRGVRIKYVDIQSLYPAVMFFDALPVGHPKCLRYDEGTTPPQPSRDFLESFFGLIECDIQPTRFLYHPVLSSHRQGGLVNILAPLKRYVTTSIELQLALKSGYQIDHVYRIDEYQSSRKLFKSYIRKWLRLKIVSSRVAAIDRPQLAEICRQWKRQFGIHIRPDEFIHNEPMRQLAKDKLNNLWGKFGQDDQVLKTELFQQPDLLGKYHANIRSKNYQEVTSVSFSQSAVLKQFKQRVNFPSKYLPIAVFVTANAWKRLWTQLELVGERAFYHDTDSILYQFDPDLPNIKTGVFLGNWEEEYRDSVITKFICIAPKMYAITYTDGQGCEKSDTKGKGFTFTSANRFTIDDYEKVLDSDEFSTTITLDQHRFDRDNNRQPCMMTYQFSKKMVFQYRKGLLDKRTWKTYPFGSRRFLPVLGEYDWWEGSLTKDIESEECPRLPWALSVDLAPTNEETHGS